MASLPDHAHDNIVRLPELLRRVRVHRATIYRWIAAGRFPAGIPLGVNSTGWYESDINAWVADPVGWAPEKVAA